MLVLVMIHHKKSNFAGHGDKKIEDNFMSSACVQVSFASCYYYSNY